MKDDRYPGFCSVYSSSPRFTRSSELKSNEALEIISRASSYFPRRLWIRNGFKDFLGNEDSLNYLISITIVFIVQCSSVAISLSSSLISPLP